MQAFIDRIMDDNFSSGEIFCIDWKIWEEDEEILTIQDKLKIVIRNFKVSKDPNKEIHSTYVSLITIINSFHYYDKQRGRPTLLTASSNENK